MLYILYFISYILFCFTLFCFILYIIINVFLLLIAEDQAELPLLNNKTCTPTTSNLLWAVLWVSFWQHPKRAETPKSDHRMSVKCFLHFSQAASHFPLWNPALKSQKPGLGWAGIPSLQAQPLPSAHKCVCRRFVGGNKNAIMPPAFLVCISWL